MKIFIKHILRNIKENKGRTFLILTSLFGTAIVVSILFAFIFSLNELINSFISGIVTFDYQVFSSNEENLTFDRIKNVDSNFDYLGLPDYNYGYIKDSKDNFVKTNLTGLNVENAKKLKLIKLENDDIDSLKDNEIIISKKYADENKLDINSVINYYSEDKIKYELTVKGIAETTGILFAKNNYTIVSNENTLLTISKENEIKYDEFLLKYTGNKDKKKLTEYIYSVEDDYGLDFYDSMEDISDVWGMLKPFLIFPIICIFLIILVFFTVNSIVKIIIEERIPIIGTFRSLGATQRQMNLILLAEMSTYGLIGGIFGGLVGSAVAKLIFALFEDMSSSIGIEISMNYGNVAIYIMILTILFMVSFQIALSIAEIIKSNKLSIKDCIFNKNEKIYKYSIIKILIGIAFLIISIITLVLNSKVTIIHVIIGILSIFISIAFLVPFITKLISDYIIKKDNPVIEMAKNTIKNNRLQIGSNIIMGVMLCISLIAFSVLNYIKAGNEEKINMIKSDIYVDSTNESMNLLSEIASLNNVKEAGALYYSNLDIGYSEMTFANNKINNLTIIYSDDYEKIEKNSNIIKFDGKLANNLKNDEVIISNYLKEKYNLKLGDVIVLNGRTKSKRFTVDTPYNLKIVGFMDSDNIENSSIILSDKIALQESIRFLGFSYMIYLVNVQDENKINETKEDISKLLTSNDFELYTNKEYKEEVQSQIDSNFIKLSAILFIIISISLIGIINNQSVSFLERKKELAILYSTSMSRKQINNMIMIEMLLSYIICGLLSLIFTFMLIELIKCATDLSEMYMQIKFSFSGIIIIFVVIAIIMFIIYLVMKKKIKKMNIVEELKYE